MAASSTFFSPSLFLCVLVLIDITLAVSLDTDMKLKSENNNHLQNQETWPQQPRSGHHHKHGLAKKGGSLPCLLEGSQLGKRPSEWAVELQPWKSWCHLASQQR